MRHLNSEKILVNGQHGFRKGRSCDTQLSLFVEDMQCALVKHQEASINLFLRMTDKDSMLLSSVLPLLKAPVRFSKQHHTRSIVELFSNANLYKYSFFPRTIRAWNALPSNSPILLKVSKWRVRYMSFCDNSSDFNYGLAPLLQVKDWSQSNILNWIHYSKP